MIEIWRYCEFDYLPALLAWVAAVARQAEGLALDIEIAEERGQRRRAERLTEELRLLRSGN